MRPAKSRGRARLAAWGRALTPTVQEQWIVAVILLSMLAGAVTMHYRGEYRLTHPVRVSPTPWASARNSGE